MRLRRRSRGVDLPCSGCGSRFRQIGLSEIPNVEIGCSVDVIMAHADTQAAGVEGDAELLRRLRTGESGAYEALVREMGPRLYATALRILHREEDARDAVQDAFLSAFRSLPKFAGDSSLSTWMHRIAINACLMKLRTRRRKPERSIEELLPRYSDNGHRVQVELADQHGGERPGAALDQRETGEMVRGAIEELPENYRIVLVLRDIEGLDTLEAATVLGMTENALKTRLHRARQALRELLSPRMGRISELGDVTRVAGGKEGLVS